MSHRSINSHLTRPSECSRFEPMIGFSWNLPRFRFDLGLQERILKFLKVSQPSPTESEGVALENFLLESFKLGIGTK